MVAPQHGSTAGLGGRGDDRAGHPRLDAVTGAPRYVICAVGRDDGDFVFTPFGHLADGNPYDAYLPPDPGDPEGFVRPEPGEAP